MRGPGATRAPSSVSACRWAATISSRLTQPVGVASANALAERPDLAMLGPDAENESPAGAYLAAAVIYPTLYDLKP